LNDIVVKQDSADALNLLRARRRALDAVKRVQRVYFFIVMLLPILSVLAASFWVEAKLWVSGAAVLVTVIDFYLIDRWQKDNIKLSARLQEHFDCLVLSMPWNDFTAGKQVDPEEIFVRSKRNLSASVEATFPGWYPASVEKLPLALGRLACQRTNLWYDAQLRDHYARWILGFELTFIAALLISGFALGTSYSDFVLTKLVPFAPLVVWLERERRRHKDSEANLLRLLNEINNSISRFIQAPSDTAAEARSRQLQDAIFAHRSTSPLVSNIVYKLRRSSMEEQMDVGAEQFIARLAAQGQGGAA
jgi:hypothetical protein